MHLWESANKTIRKESFQLGCLRNFPTEQSVCTIIINKCKVSECTIKLIQECLHSTLLSNVKCEKKIVIGEAASSIDRSIEQAIQHMSEGERSLITVQSQDESLEKILTIPLEITLQHVNIFKPIWEWTHHEKYDIALKYKEIGVSLFSSKRIVDAFHMFSKACKILITLEPIEFQEQDMDEIWILRIILYNNMAECHLCRQNYDHVITLCNKILTRTRKNVKALYRRGVAYGNLRNYEKAVQDMKEVVSLDPKNCKAKDHYTKYKEHLRVEEEKYEDMVKKMFKT